MENIGKIIVLIGGSLVVVGLIIWFLGDRFGWFGNLPGDIKIVTPSFGCFFPLTSMIIISIILSVLLSLLARFFK